MDDQLEPNKEHARRNELKDMLDDDSMPDPPANKQNTRMPLAAGFSIQGDVKPTQLTAEMHPTIAKVQDMGKMADLVGFAEYIVRREKCDTQVFFQTEVGVIRLQAIAISGEPATAPPDSLIFVVVDPERLSFTPKIGMALRMSRKETSGFVEVICLSPPVKLTVGLGIDLMCFVRQAPAMEKNGKVETDGNVVSVVSGRPATRIDPKTGEPITDNEIPADIKKAAKHFEPRLTADT
jgi:hypothetical protein